MAMSLWELRSNLSLKGATSNTERITQSSENYLRKRKVNTSVICYVVTWMKTVSLTVLSFTTTALSHCLSFLSAFFILSHFKIIRGIMKSLTTTSTNFLLKYNWKKKTWKMFFECPNRYTGFPNSLNTSLIIFRVLAAVLLVLALLYENCPLINNIWIYHSEQNFYLFNYLLIFFTFI